MCSDSVDSKMAKPFLSTRSKIDIWDQNISINQRSINQRLKPQHCAVVTNKNCLDDINSNPIYTKDVETILETLLLEVLFFLLSWLNFNPFPTDILYQLDVKQSFLTLGALQRKMFGFLAHVITIIIIVTQGSANSHKRDLQLLL